MMRGRFFSYQLGSAIRRVLPYGACRGFAKIAASIYASYAFEDLRTVRYNLSCALPDLSVTELAKLARRLFTNFALYLVDFFYSDDYRSLNREGAFAVVGKEHLDRALTRGRGVILASAHLGNWEIGGMTLARLGYPVSGIALDHRDARVNAFFNHRRQRNDMKIIPFGRSFRKALRILQKGEIVALNGDRLFAGRGTEVRFMGKKVCFPRGLAALAEMTGAQVLPAFFIPEPGRYRMEIGPALDPSKGSLIQSFAIKLEEMIRRHPSYWFVFQRFDAQLAWSSG